MQRLLWLLLLIGVLLFFMTSCQSNDDTNSSSQNNSEKPSDEEDVTANQEYEKLPKTPLQKLDQGEQVVALQYFLEQLGYSFSDQGNYNEQVTWAITDFQIQQEDLLVSGIYDEDTKQKIEEVIQSEKTYKPGKGLPAPTEPAFTDAGTEVISNPYDQLVLVNKDFSLPADYIPDDLVIPNVPFPFIEDIPKKYMRQAAADALEELFADAQEEGLELYAQSGYRSYDRQDTIFAANAAENGEKHANKYSARPGESEHQTGLAMDVTSPEVNFSLETEFGETKEGKWVKENATNYGFIIRFPEGKEEITKYQFEPWHLRYVGQKAAEEIMNQNITLEEYLEK
ncbi:D-alanyl-D-alanine carboxypeptidase family protein [Oceanobacillus kimchii]|uniref:D-alanyl-D-alanine carboxypeptidase family protein n=1 Tax=Oceanobacillus kimchii TaxID=746691 RepID=UPI0021A88F7E|nr:D-alanyl-D-alanine carboxypeptidase family protein [Oceanobacillus kimchii]MCT1577422.1 D-alanyl-D-alanine carboxypeptidase family protein [Oceanobacillus kimchii]MCT2137028.1 D-alanyl-D-alanine carboxypeptidase family protein [Oceanobacillus kimchii]